MKANDTQAKKTLSAAQLHSELRQVQEELFHLRFKHRVSPVANPAEIVSLRRHAARLKTWLGQKALADAAAASTQEA